MGKRVYYQCGRDARKVWWFFVDISRAGPTAINSPSKAYITLYLHPSAWRILEFEGLPARVMLEMAIFDEQGDKYNDAVIDVFQTVDDRDNALKTGMKKWAIESRDRFAKLLKSSRASKKANTAEPTKMLRRNGVSGTITTVIDTK